MRFAYFLYICTMFLSNVGPLSSARCHLYLSEARQNYPCYWKTSGFSFMSSACSPKWCMQWVGEEPDWMVLCMYGTGPHWVSSLHLYLLPSLFINFMCILITWIYIICFACYAQVLSPTAAVEQAINKSKTSSTPPPLPPKPTWLVDIPYTYFPGGNQLAYIPGGYPLSLNDCWISCFQFNTCILTFAIGRVCNCSFLIS